jgi:hypothetical protein
MSPAQVALHDTERKLRDINAGELAKVAANADKQAAALSEKQRLEREHAQAVHDLAVENYYTGQARYDRAIELAQSKLPAYRKAAEAFAKAHAEMLAAIMVIDSCADVHASPARIFHGSNYAPRPAFEVWRPDLPGIVAKDWFIDQTSAIEPAFKAALAELDS